MTSSCLPGMDTDMERSSGWLPLSSLETLKLDFNVFSDNQGSHPDDLFISVDYFTGNWGRRNWRLWVNESIESSRNFDLNKTKSSTTNYVQICEDMLHVGVPIIEMVGIKVVNLEQNTMSVPYSSLSLPRMPTQCQSESQNCVFMLMNTVF